MRVYLLHRPILLFNQMRTVISLSATIFCFQESLVGQLRLIGTMKVYFSGAGPSTARDFPCLSVVLSLCNHSAPDESWMLHSDGTPRIQNAHWQVCWQLENLPESGETRNLTARRPSYCGTQYGSFSCQPLGDTQVKREICINLSINLSKILSIDW